MLRSDLLKTLGATDTAILPVIHVRDEDQVAANVECVSRSGAHGCFLINHDFDAITLLPFIRQARKSFPDLWIGVNFLGVAAGDAFSLLARLADAGCRVDGYWADEAYVSEAGAFQPDAARVSELRKESKWHGLYFGGTAFKYRRAVPPEQFRAVADAATRYMDVVTTSGPSTGEAAAPSKIAAFREGVGDHALAIASGITPDNAATYTAADCFLVATGINKPGNFYEIDPAKLDALVENTRAV